MAILASASLAGDRAAVARIADENSGLGAAVSLLGRHEAASLCHRWFEAAVRLPIQGMNGLDCVSH